MQGMRTERNKTVCFCVSCESEKTWQEKYILGEYWVNLVYTECASNKAFFELQIKLQQSLQTTRLSLKCMMRCKQSLQFVPPNYKWHSLTIGQSHCHDTIQLEFFSEDIPHAVLWYNCGTEWLWGVVRETAGKAGGYRTTLLPIRYT